MDTAALFVRYQNQQGAHRAARSAELAAASAKKAAAIEAVKRASRLHRGAIKLAGGSGLTRKLSYGLASQATRQALDKIGAAYQRERERISQRNNRMGWHEWLQAEAKAGNVEALAALRAREGRRHKPVNAVQASPSAGHGFSTTGRVDHITRRGTIIYRAGGAAVRDDGTSLHVSRGAEIDGITATLRIARDRYGEELSIAGSAEFRERVAQAAANASLQIRFDDPELERRRQALVAGLARQDAAKGQGKPVARKPKVVRIGRHPPPEARDRVRSLDDLGVVSTDRPSPQLLRHARSKADATDPQRDRLLDWEAAGTATRRIEDHPTAKPEAEQIAGHASRRRDDSGTRRGRRR
jgi:hypothetical protein